MTTVRVSFESDGAYHWATPEHGAFSHSELAWVREYMKYNNYRFKMRASPTWGMQRRSSNAHKPTLKTRGNRR